MSWFWIGIGGGLGSLARYFISVWISRRQRSSFPLATGLINITGSFLLGMAMVYLNPDSSWPLFFNTGFLGGFTTLSTFSVEAVHTFARNPKTGLLYILFNAVLSMLGYGIGATILQIFGSK